MRSVLFLLVFLCSFVASTAEDFAVLEKTINKVEIYGYTRAYKNLTITSEVAGKCLKTSGELGSIVKENDIVFTFDDTNTKLLINQCKLSIDIAARQIVFFDKEVERTEKLLKSAVVNENLFNELVLKRDLAIIEKKLKENQLEQLIEESKKFSITGPVGYTLEQRFLEVGSLAGPGVPLALYGDYQRLIIPISVTFEEFKILEGKKEFDLELVDYQKKAKAKLLRRHSNFDEQSRKILVDLELLEYPVEKVGGVKTLLVLETPATNSFTITEKAINESYEEYNVVTDKGLKIKVKILKSNKGTAEIQGQGLELGMKLKLKN
jgi:hypothetical protein